MERQAQAAQPLHRARGALGPPLISEVCPGLRIAAVLVLGFQFCGFLQGALREKGFQSGHI